MCQLLNDVENKHKSSFKLETFISDSYETAIISQKCISDKNQINLFKGPHESASSLFLLETTSSTILLTVRERTFIPSFYGN